MNEQWKERDRRSCKRYLVDFTIRLCLAGTDQCHISHAGNICYGGALLRSKVPYEVEATVDVEISYLAEQQVTEHYPGIVKWVDVQIDEKNGEKIYFIGVQFDEMSDEKYTVLKEFIETFIRVPKQ